MICGNCGTSFLENDAMVFCSKCWAESGDARQALRELVEAVGDPDILHELHMSKLGHIVHIAECAAGKILGGGPELSEEVIEKIGHVEKALARAKRLEGK